MALISWVFGSWAWAADPLAVRSLAGGGGAVIGTGALSVAMPVHRLELGVVARPDGGSVGLVAGSRREWVRGGVGDAASEPRDARAFAALGVAGTGAWLPVAGGAAVGATPWASLGIRGRAGGVSGSLAAPTLAGTNGVLLPVVAGLEGALHVGGGWAVSAVVTVGAGFTPGLDTSLRGDVALGLVRSSAFLPTSERRPPAPEHDPR